MIKDILYGQEAREKILEGVHIVSKAVKTTLGPKGRESFLQKENGENLILSAGGEIIPAIDLDDPFRNIGTGIIKEMASAVRDAVGDGVSTAIVITDAILQEGCRNIAAGANAIELRKGIQGAVQLSCAAIKKITVPVENTENIRQVVFSSVGDEFVGKLVSMAIEKLGADGIISAEETPQMETSLEITEGMQYEKGYLNAEMLKAPEEMKEELQEPYILVTDNEISDAQDILPLMEQIRASGHPLLVIAENVTASALSMLILNKKQGIVNTVAVHPPAYGDGRQAFMEDICVFTGGKFITEKMGLSLRDVNIEMLGMAERVTVSRGNTVIINGNGKKEDVQAHLKGLGCLMKNENYGFKKERLKKQIARFSSGTAVIKVGAATETEMKELKYRVDNGIRTAQAAISEGIVSGGGTAYMDILPAVSAYVKTLEGDRKTGASIVAKALEAPLRQIAENGGKDPSVVCSRVKAMKRGTGYDVRNDSYVDMMENGIIDSAKIIRLALQCAGSAASSLLTMEAGAVVRAD